MRIGIDFDNTIVCYDDLIYQCALQKKLIPASIDKNKQSIRNYLRNKNDEELWTELQGYVYGPGIQFTKPYNDFISFLQLCKKNKIDVVIVSHKTKYPYAGELYDLHAFAQKWLRDNGIIGNDPLVSKVFFELTKEDKIRRIENLDCTHFIDDLPEFLLEPFFSSDIVKILFDPHEKNINFPSLFRFSSWIDISHFLIEQVG